MIPTEKTLAQVLPKEANVKATYFGLLIGLLFGVTSGMTASARRASSTERLAGGAAGIALNALIYTIGHRKAFPAFFWSSGIGAGIGRMIASPLPRVEPPPGGILPETASGRQLNPGDRVIWLPTGPIPITMVMRRGR